MGNIKIRYLTEASSAEVYSGNLVAGALDTDLSFGELTRSFNFNQVVLGGSGALGGPGSPFVFNDTSTEQVFQGGISAPGISLMGNLDITGRISGNVTGYFNKLYITGDDSQWYQITTGWSGAGAGGAASSPWVEQSNNIHYYNSTANQGHVGIGDWVGAPPPYGLTVKEKDGIVVSEDTAVSALGTQFLIVGGAESSALSSAEYGVSIKQVKETISNGYGMAFWGRSQAPSSSYTEKMRLSHSGYLGIGTAEPISILNLDIGTRDTPFNPATPTASWGDLIVHNRSDALGAAAGIRLVVENSDPDHGTAAGAGIAAVRRDAANEVADLAFMVDPAVPGPPIEAMRLSHSGYLGIGTTTPRWPLDIEVVGTSVQIQLGRTNTNVGSTWMGSDSNGFHLGVGEYNAGGGTAADPHGFTVDTNGALNVSGEVLAPSGYFNNLYITGSNSQWYQVTTGWSGDGGGGGASSPWTQLPGHIFYNDPGAGLGHVGIGDFSSPVPHGLTVKEKDGIAVTENTTVAPDGTQFLMIQGGDTLAPAYGSSIKLVKEGPVATDFGMSFWTMDNPTFADEKMRLSSEGYLGIGTPTPQHQLTVSGDAEISGILSVSTDHLTEGGQFILNLPGSSGPTEGAGNFSIDAFKDNTNAYGFGLDSGLFRMFHGGGGAGGAPVTKILSTSSGGSVVLGSHAKDMGEFAKVTVGGRLAGIPTPRDAVSFGSQGVIDENGISINSQQDLVPPLRTCGATLALYGGMLGIDAQSSSISSNRSGLHIRNHSDGTTTSSPQNIVFDLTHNTNNQGKAPVLQLSGQDNAVILDFDSLPSTDPGVKGQIYRNGSNALYVSGP